MRSNHASSSLHVRLASLLGLSLGMVLLAGATLAGCSSKQEAPASQTPPAQEQAAQPGANPAQTASVQAEALSTSKAPAAAATGVGTATTLPPSLAKALDLFRSTFPAAQLTEVEYGTDDGMTLYQIKGFDNGSLHVLKVNAQTNEIVKQMDKKVGKAPQGFAMDKVITPDQAIKEAMTARPGSWTIREWKLETEEVRTVYQVELVASEGAHKLEVSVDAITGAIVKIDG